MSKSKTAIQQSKARKSRSRDRGSAQSTRAAIIEQDGFGVTTVTIRSKSGAVSVVRSNQTGRFTTRRSAHVIDRGAERFARTLKRLATK